MQRFILILLALCFSIHTQGSIGLILLREEGIGKNLTSRADTIFATLALYPTWYRATPLYSEEKLQKELRLYDGLNTIWEMDGNGTKTREYVTELGLDDILYEIQNGTYKYYHTDGLGSVTGITNETQQLIKRNYYRAYGEIYRSWGSNKSKIGFTSRDLNKDTGLIDLRARQYDPVIGRFISPDPFSRGPDDPRVRDMYKSSWYSKIHGELTLYTSFMKPNEFNRYAYCNNNPVNYVDPLGLWSTKYKKTHQNSIDRALSFLSDEDRGILKEAQVTADADQSTNGAYKHLMRSSTESVEGAKKKSNMYVKGMIQTAKTLESKGHHKEALEYLGLGMHTMQDGTSPAHKGGQIWDANSSLAEKSKHVATEFYDPGPGSTLDYSTRRAYAYFKSKKSLPEGIVQ